MRSGRNGVVVTLVCALVGGLAVLGLAPMPSNSVEAQDEPVSLFSGEVVNVRGDAARTGVLPGSGPAGDPFVLWSTPVEVSTFTPGLAYDGERVIINGLDPDHGGTAGLSALDAATGAFLWSQTGASDPVPPLLASGVAISMDDVNWRVVDIATGDGFGTDTNRPANGPPRVSAFVDGAVYLGMGDWLYRGVPRTYEYANGCCGFEIQVDWSFDVPGGVVTSTSVGEGLVVIGTGTYLHAVGQETGGERWRVPLEPLTDPVIAGGSVFIGDVDGVLHAFDTETGQERWSFAQEEPFNILNSPVVMDDTVYWRTNDRVFALDAASGEQRWQVDASGGSNLMAAGGVLFVGTTDQLLALDPANGDQRWSATVDATSIRVAPFSAGNGVIFGIWVDADYVMSAFAVAGREGEHAIEPPTPTPMPVAGDAVVEVTRDGAELRAAPSAEGVVLETLAEGTALHLGPASETVGETIWWPATNPESGTRGYIEEAAIAFVDFLPTPTPIPDEQGVAAALDECVPIADAFDYVDAGDVCVVGDVLYADQMLADVPDLYLLILADDDLRGTEDGGLLSVVAAIDESRLPMVGDVARVAGSITVSSEFIDAGWVVPPAIELLFVDNENLQVLDSVVE